MSNRDIEQLMRDAEALAAEVERSLSNSHGLAFEQFPEVNSQQQDYIVRKAQALVDKDLQEIERQLSGSGSFSAPQAPASTSVQKKRIAVKKHKMI